MLETGQIKTILEKPKNKLAVSEARDQEDWLRFHCETHLTRFTANRKVTDHLNWVESLLPSDIFRTFAKLIQFPLQTVDVVNDAVRFFEKIFDGRNPVQAMNFRSPRALEDYGMYRAQINVEEKFRKIGMKAVHYAANTALVVDLPDIQETPQPEPYFYAVDIYNIRDFGTYADGSFEWIMFDLGNQMLALYCDGYYRILDISQGVDKFQIVVENPHDLGYCPATWFNDEPVNDTQKNVKKAIPTNSLGELDYYLFFDNCHKYVNLYVPFPIYTGLAQECDFEMDDDGTGAGHLYCYRGFLRNGDDQYLLSHNGKIKECPVCSKNQKAGLGAYIEYQPPSDENNFTNLANPVQMLQVDTGALEYNYQESERRSKNLVLKMTGHKTDLINDQAVNQRQVRSIFDSGANVLKKRKAQFEKKQAWLEKTIAALRYGPEQIIEIEFDYGSEFFTLTAEELLESYHEARQKGASDQVLDQILSEYYSTKYRNNPTMLQRSKILTALDPLLHSSKKDAIALFQQGVIDRDTMMIKIKLSTLINRFERENGDLLQFGSALGLGAQVDRIKSILLTYVQEDAEAVEGTQNSDEDGNQQVNQNQQ
jgi:hypothetical protein